MPWQLEPRRDIFDTKKNVAVTLQSMDTRHLLTCIGYDSIHEQSICHRSSNGASADKAGDALGATSCTVPAPRRLQTHDTTESSWHPDAATPIIACTADAPSLIMRHTIRPLVDNQGPLCQGSLPGRNTK